MAPSIPLWPNGPPGTPSSAPNGSNPSQPPPVSDGSTAQPVRGAVDEWLLSTEIGRGTFGTVRCADGKGPAMGLAAVCKTTPISTRLPGQHGGIDAQGHYHPSGPRARLATFREVLALAWLPPHRGIPRLFDFASDQSGNLHLVISRAPGMGVLSYVASQEHLRLPESEARWIVAGTVEAVRHVQENNVIHRDVKADNLFYDPASRTVTLLDFGLATFFDPGAATPQDIHQRGMVAPGEDDEIWGHPTYATPAALKASLRGTPRPAADRTHAAVWCIGILTYALLTGFFPFVSDDPAGILAEIESGKVTLPADLDVSAEARDFVDRLLDPDPLRIGMLTPRQILGHPWIAEFAPHPIPPVPVIHPGTLPRLVSATAKHGGFDAALASAEYWASRVVPGALKTFAEQLAARNRELPPVPGRDKELPDAPKAKSAAVVQKLRSFGGRLAGSGSGK